MATWFRPEIAVDTAFETELNTHIDRALLEQDKADTLVHNADRRWPADRLSAGRLWQPLQWQALKALGCPARVPDAYAQRLFLRGNQCEAWLVSMLEHCVKRAYLETQVPVEYRDVVGYIDVQVREEGSPQLKPFEIKSVANMKYKRIKAQGPDRSHLLQACLYALAIKAPTFGIIYVAADDYRVLPYTVETTRIKADVEKVIYDFTVWKGLSAVYPFVPPFEPGEKWHANPKYNSYPEWSGLDAKECAIKLALEQKSWTKTAVLVPV